AGKTYDVYLRFQRTYKPYTFHLKEFRHDRYPGTEIPSNYSSTIRLVDPAQNEDREVLISMNSPLRYGGKNPIWFAGETFYQQGWLPGYTGTVLQVVSNPGWLLPYISCGLVSLGLLIHCGILLNGFIRRMQAEEAARASSRQAIPVGEESLAPSADRKSR